MLSCRDMAPWLSTHSAPVEVLHRTSKWGEVRRLACPLRRFPFAAHRTAGERWWRQPPKGGSHYSSKARLACFPTPAGRLYGFRRQRRYKKWRRRRRTSPAQRYYITPEGGALNPPVRRSRSQAEPLAPRAERPGGAINPRGEAASTFGNTGKHRPGPIPHPPKFQIPIHLKKEGKFYASKNSTQNH